MHLCPIIVFPSRKWFSNELLPKLVEKIKQLYALPVLIKCHSTTASLDKLMFVSKNWPKDSKIGCKSLSSLTDFIESDPNLEEEFEEFEGAFEKDEVVEL